MWRLGDRAVAIFPKFDLSTVAADDDFPFLPRRISRDKTMRRKGPFDVTPGCDERVIADSGSRANHGMGRNETAVSNARRLTMKRRLVPCQCALNCVVRIDMCTRTDIDIVADRQAS